MARVYHCRQGWLQGRIRRQSVAAGRAAPIIGSVSEVDAAVAEQRRRAGTFLKFWTDDAYGSVKRMPFDIADAIISSGPQTRPRVMPSVLPRGRQAPCGLGVDALAHSVRDQMMDQQLIDLMNGMGPGWRQRP